jgi:hypothetical protein
MTGGKIFAGSGEAWLRDAVSHPAGRIAADVSEQIELMADLAAGAAVLMHPRLAAATLQRDEHTGRGYLPVCGLPVLLCYEVGGPVVVTQFLLDAIRRDNPTLITEETLL